MTEAVAGRFMTEGLITAIQMMESRFVWCVSVYQSFVPANHSITPLHSHISAVYHSGISAVEA